MDNETDQYWQESESPQIIASFLDTMKTAPIGHTESIYTKEELNNLYGN